MDNKIIILPQDDYRVTEKSTKKIGVFIHLYYEDTVLEYCSYIEKIPRYIDVYITTSNKKTYWILLNWKQTKNRNIFLIKAPNRGRDVGALLVTFKPYIESYEYICFTHDKKEKNIAQKNFAEQFAKCIWSNLLYSEEYIECVIGLLEKETNVGVLLPPMYTGEYSKAWFSSDWGNNYENTCLLAENLGVNRELMREDCPPAAYGTAFWAKTVALKKLFVREWKYEDFLQEPLPDDGELNHAIERILQYVALDAGYNYLNIISIPYAQEHIEYLQMHIKETGTYLNNLLGVRCLNEFRNMEKTEERLISFCSQYDVIYIYGSGVYGKSCLRLLKMLNIKVQAFLRSDDNDKDRIIEGTREISVWSIGEDKKIGIIIASILKNNIHQMIDNLKIMGQNNWMLYMPEYIDE